MIVNNICYSGGAEGADLTFGEFAQKAGHQVVHFSYKGHKKIQQPHVILSQEELDLADPFLKEANKVLKRTFPTDRLSVNNLLRRNFWQIKDTNCVFAIAGIDSTGLIYGGTAWAVTMAWLKGIREIFVFDQQKDDWFKMVKNNQWIKDTPAPLGVIGKYTGIGSRKLEPNGLNAIKGLYTCA